LDAKGKLLPVEDNTFRLSTDQVDIRDFQKLSFREWKGMMIKCSGFIEQQTMMYEKAGFQPIFKVEGTAAHCQAFGIHEMVALRMGKDPKTSLLTAGYQLITVRMSLLRTVHA